MAGCWLRRCDAQASSASKTQARLIGSSLDVGGNADAEAFQRGNDFPRGAQVLEGAPREEVQLAASWHLLQCRAEEASCIGSSFACVSSGS